MANNLAKMQNKDVATKNRPSIRNVDRKTPHNCDMVIADLSGSMSSEAFEGKSRYQCLQQALAPFKGRVQVLAFNSRVWEVDADSLPQPDMFTAMAKAIETAIQLEPLHVLMISDGLPDNRTTALQAADQLAQTCIMDVMYIGPEDENAEGFMQELANVGRGRYINFRVDKESPMQLESEIDSLLALPAPGSIEL